MHNKSKNRKVFDVRVVLKVGMQIEQAKFSFPRYHNWISRLTIRRKIFSKIHGRMWLRIHILFYVCVVNTNKDR